MEYVLSWHAQGRMRKRRIAAADVEAVLIGYHSCWHDSAQESYVLTGLTATGRTLVVFVPDDNWPPTAMITIKSAAWR